MLLFTLSFVAGVLTVLAPCILPLLPVIVGGSVNSGENKKKAFTVSASLFVSVVLFTFLLKVSTVFIGVPQEFWVFSSGMIIILFGLVSLFPNIWERIPLVSRLSIGSNKVLGVGYQKNSFWGDVIIGASLGPVFTTCSPTYFVVLATVLPQSFLLGFVDLLAYSFGLSGFLLLISFLGQKILYRIGGISDTHSLLRRGIGVLFIVFGLFILLGIDKKIETKLLDLGYFDITKFEQKLLQKNQSEVSNDIKDDTISETNIKESTTNSYNSRKMHGPVAPEIINPSGFINTNGEPVTIKQFRDKKVILLDVWTYSCINCQRTLPYIKAWYEKYKDRGLVVIGLHTPEFSFEKVKSNVEDAVKKFGLNYPVVMDNDYSTWTAYGNQYWPRKYLISVDGEIVYDHIGEGNYEETEKAIQEALNELNDKFTVAGLTEPEGQILYDPNKIKSPEIYFGSNRNKHLSNGKNGVSGVQSLVFPENKKNNELYLSGTWNFYPEYATNLGPGEIFFRYNSKNVYIVSSSAKGITVGVYVDGVKLKDLEIKSNNLYNLVDGLDYGEHDLEIRVPEAGLEVFTFTFG